MILSHPVQNMMRYDALMMTANAPRK